MAGVGISSGVQENATADEAVNLSAGFSYLTLRDYRMDPEHPPLGKMLNAIPLTNAVVCSRVREPQEALSAATIALDISTRNSRVAALQKRRDRLRAGIELTVDEGARA
jgi:hypothetical protein